MRGAGAARPDGVARTPLKDSPRPPLKRSFFCVLATIVGSLTDNFRRVASIRSAGGARAQNYCGGPPARFLVRISLGREGGAKIHLPSGGTDGESAGKLWPP